jgi:hypothetical protein
VPPYFGFNEYWQTMIDQVGREEHVRKMMRNAKEDGRMEQWVYRTMKQSVSQTMIKNSRA